MAKAEKTEQPVEAVVVEPEQKSDAPRKKTYRTGSIFWGFAFVFVGALLLLDNLNIVSVHFENLWHLWPLLIIGAGVSILSLRGWLSAVITFILIVTFGVLAYLVAVDNPYYNLNSVTQAQTTTLDGSTAILDDKSVDLTIKTGAIDLNIISRPEQQGYLANLSSGYMTLNQTANNATGGVRYITLETTSKNEWWMGMGMMHSSLALELTQRLPLSLHIETGASTVVGDLSDMQLKNLTLKAGASSISLKFGANQASQDVRLEAGASSVSLRVPTSAGVRVETNNGLSSTNLAGLNKISDNVYETPGFSSTEKQISIHTQLGVSSLELSRY